jgi:hypothetical protein
MFKKETFKVERLSPSGKWAYGMAYGHVNRHAWISARRAEPELATRRGEAVRLAAPVCSNGGVSVQGAGPTRPGGHPYP